MYANQAAESMRANVDRAAASQPTERREMPELQRELDTLHGALGDLEVRAAHLRDRLEPVSFQSPPQPAVDSCAQVRECSPGSTIGVGIRNARDRVANLIEHIEAMAEKLAV